MEKMQVVILAGGLGTRLQEETHVRPKPMVEIGEHPILWHVMKSYAHFGMNEFIVCAGYKGDVIKDYFANYALYNSSVTFDIAKGTVDVHENEAEDWRVTVVNTGDKTMTGGRIKRIRRFLKGDAFCMTYGDGVGDVDIAKLVAFHRSHGKLATITAVQPPGRFGSLELSGTSVRSFTEKPTGDGAWINGGFFVLSPRVIDEIEGDDTVWEMDPLGALARRGELEAYFHHGFWQPMDTLRDKRHLEELWAKSRAPWAPWRGKQRSE